MSKKPMHIGLDDTDSTRRGCTTYIAAVLVEKLTKLGACFIDYPSLVRLNPNVPWKTRGNGALCLRIRYDGKMENKIKETVTSTVEENADLDWKGTDPGIVFLSRPNIPREIEDFSNRAVRGIVTLKEASSLLTKFNGEAIGYKNGRGIIGALAAVGATFKGDYTFEVLVYRTSENRGTKRRVDEASILKMDQATTPSTFNNIDAERRRVIITPRGPDPILFGVRGENPETVEKAFQMIRCLEPVERWVIFRSNQGTDAHLRRVSNLSQLERHGSITANGVILSSPKMIKGRHVVFQLGDDVTSVDCAAYEPTGTLNRAARQLIPGDSLEVSGSVRSSSPCEPITLNLEKFRVLSLAPKVSFQNPICSRCGKRLKSMGKDKGFRCEKCGFRDAKAEKIRVEKKRELKEELYVCSTRSQRHLTKPLVRYGLEKHDAGPEELIDCWHFP